MDKYKICPSCGERNIPTIFECVFCEADLTSVRIVDDQTQNQSVSFQTAPSQPELVRICDCGTTNPSAVRKCTSCGEDISDITPTGIPPTDTATTFSLCSMDGEYAFLLSKPVNVIGREREMSDYLGDKNFVSRIHAKITIVNSEVYIENQSNTNFTYVNNEKINNDAPHLLKDGDEIGLGGIETNGIRPKDAAYFILKVSSCI